MNRRTFGWILGSGMAAIAGPPSVLAADQQAVTEAIAAMVSRRDQCSEYVLEVKRKLQPDDANYQKARDLYVTAYAKQNGWVAVLKNAIQKGKTKNLAKDEAYQSIAAQADEAARAFVTFAQSLPGTARSRSIPAALAAAVGLSLWQKIKEQRQMERDAEAERFERETKWSTWEAIRPEA
jgi:hypothetical protein